MSTKTLTDYIALHPNRTAAANALGTNLVQLKRWEDVGCIVAQGKLWRPVKQCAQDALKS